MKLKPTFIRISKALRFESCSIKTRITLRFVMVSLAAILVLPIGTGIVQPAAAAKSDCSSDRLCLWFDIDYGGLRTDYYAPISSGCHNLSPTFNDKVTSAYNRTPKKVAFYVNANCPSGQSHWDLQGGDYVSWLGLYGHNDEFSSFAY